MKDKKMNNNKPQPDTRRRDPFYAWLGYLSQPALFIVWYIFMMFNSLRCFDSCSVSEVDNPFWTIPGVYVLPGVFLLSFIIYILLFVYAKRVKNIKLLSYAKSGLWSYLIFTVPVDLFLISEIIRTTH